jgi:hypothetical protein
MSASNPQLILLFVILGAAAAVCCAWAVTHYWTDANEPELFEPSASQAQYMREVREPGRDMLWQDVLDARSAGRGRGRGKGRGFVES